MNELVPLDQLATEIRYYSQQATWSIIEIGKRLIEAKTQLSHGEWEDWLDKKVNYSAVTAWRFMKCAERFSNLSPVKDLNPSQAFALLALPANETEDFIEAQKKSGHPIEDMTKREVEKSVAEWKKRAEQAEARAEETEQKLAEAQGKEAGYKATIREQADKLANTGTSSEYLALKEAFDKQAESLRSAREQAEMYRKSWNQERENASKAMEMAQRNVEESPKYKALKKENETIKAHLQGKPLEQHAKETNQPELRRSRKEEARIVEAIDSIAAALSKLPAKVEMSEWAEVYIREQEMLLSFTRETLERSIPNLQMLLDEFKGQTGIRRIK